MAETNASGELSHAEFEREREQKRDMPASRHEETDTDSNDSGSGKHDKGIGGALSTAENAVSVVDNYENDKESIAPASAKNEETDMGSSTESSSDDGEIEREKIYSSSGHLLVHDKDTCSDEEKEYTERDESGRDADTNMKSVKAPFDEEDRPSSSQTTVTRDIAPESVELEKRSLHNPAETKDEYVTQGFTCDGNTEEDDDQLREHWMRTLQTTTSTGEIVEEIVKVLKHHQKTHDLVCPVCGSCVTRRVILRKRKRSSLISVDRWYRDPLDEAEVQEQDRSLEVMKAAEEQATQEYQDTEAFGCLACFSLFFAKGRQLLHQLQTEIGPDNVSCLPFFFPPYPWGMTQMKPTSPGLHEESLTSEEAEGAVVADVQESSASIVQSDYIRGWFIGSKTF